LLLKIDFFLNTLDQSGTESTLCFCLRLIQENPRASWKVDILESMAGSFCAI